MCLAALDADGTHAPNILEKLVNFSLAQDFECSGLHEWNVVVI